MQRQEEQLSLQRESRHRAGSICRVCLPGATSTTSTQHKEDVPEQTRPVPDQGNVQDSLAQPQSMSLTHPSQRLAMHIRTTVGPFCLVTVCLPNTRHRFLTADNNPCVSEPLYACLYLDTWIRWFLPKIRVKILAKSKKIQMKNTPFRLDFNEIFFSLNLLCFTKNLLKTYGKRCP